MIHPKSPLIPKEDEHAGDQKRPHRLRRAVLPEDRHEQGAPGDRVRPADGLAVEKGQQQAQQPVPHEDGEEPRVDDRVRVAHARGRLVDQERRARGAQKDGDEAGAYGRGGRDPQHVAQVASGTIGLLGAGQAHRVIDGSTDGEALWRPHR